VHICIFNLWTTTVLNALSAEINFFHIYRLRVCIWLSPLAYQRRDTFSCFCGNDLSTWTYAPGNYILRLHKTIIKILMTLASCRKCSNKLPRPWSSEGQIYCGIIVSRSLHLPYITNSVCGIIKDRQLRYKSSDFVFYDYHVMSSC
jgi:hypothetical protein